MEKFIEEKINFLYYKKGKYFNMWVYEIKSLIKSLTVDKQKKYYRLLNKEMFSIHMERKLNYHVIGNNSISNILSNIKNEKA